MACSACAKRRQQQANKTRSTPTTTRSQNTSGAQSQGANLRDKMRFTGRQAMSRIEVERIPGTVTDGLFKFLDQKIAYFSDIEREEAIAYIADLDGRRRAVALEARGRVLAYEEMKKLLTLKQGGCMSDIKSRARLRPRTTSVLDAMAAKVTADDVAEPKKDVVDVPENTTSVDLQGDSVPETTTSADLQSDSVPEPIQSPEVDVEDNDWLNQLTVPEPEQQAPVSQTPVVPEPEVHEPAPVPSSDDLQRDELVRRFQSLTTVDPEVAEELYNSVFAPTLEEQIKRLRETEIETMRRQVEQQQQYYQQMQQQSQQSVSDKVDAEITQKYPRDQAAKILQSVEFVQFLNSELPPYATENGYDILKRAYAAGDASYVISAMDRFKGSRAKPKPQVNADVSSGGTQVADGNKTPKKLTEAQYINERKKIMSAPRGTYPPDALTKLAEQYLKGA